MFFSCHLIYLFLYLSNEYLVKTKATLDCSHVKLFQSFCLVKSSLDLTWPKYKISDISFAVLIYACCIMVDHIHPKKVYNICHFNLPQLCFCLLAFFLWLSLSVRMKRPWTPGWGSAAFVETQAVWGISKQLQHKGLLGGQPHTDVFISGTPHGDWTPSWVYWWKDFYQLSKYMHGCWYMSFINFKLFLERSIRKKWW